MRTWTEHHNPPAPCFIDAHAHLHPRFNLAAWLDAAAHNFDFAHQRAARGSEQESSDNAHRVLLLADTPGASSLDRLDPPNQLDRWSIQRAGEPGAIIATADHTNPIHIIAGWQINTDEHLELLIPASTKPIPDGQPIAESLAAVRALGTTPIVPWGFGKWSGRRGRLLLDLLANAEPADLLLGDNAGRPRALPEHKAFHLARSRSIATLPGSDPLDLPAHIARAGSYGFVAQSGFDPDLPLTTIRHILASARPPIRSCGQRSAFIPALRDQIALRLSKTR